MEQFAAFEFTAVLELLPERLLGAGLVAVGVEFETSAALRALDGPAGEDARYLRYVCLGVAAIDAERVQFHQLAGVVFVQSLGRFLLLVWDFVLQPSSRAQQPANRGRCFRHCRDRAASPGLCAVASSRSSNLPKRERANHVALIADEVVGRRFILAQVDVEVIEPEIGHHFLQLRVGVNVARESLVDEFLRRQGAQGSRALPLSRAHLAEDRLTRRSRCPPLSDLKKLSNSGWGSDASFATRCCGGRTRSVPNKDSSTGVDARVRLHG